MLGGLIGIVPLLLYNHYAFHSWTHLAYSSIPRQQKGFFGIGVPSLPVMATLLLDSRGLLTLSPVLAMGAIGTWLLYRRGKRAEALTIAGICVCYVGYNSGYYLPFGGGFMGPRFLMTMLPFLALPIGIALKRYPGPTIALAGVSLTTTIVATITHPLVGYENEAVVWAATCGEGFFQPTIASRLRHGPRLGRDLAVPALRRRRRCARHPRHRPHAHLHALAARGACSTLAGWCAFAALGADAARHRPPRPALDRRRRG